MRNYQKSKMKNLKYLLLVFICVSACVTTKKEEPLKKYPMALSVSHEGESAIDFLIKPRVPPKENKGWLGILMGPVSGNIAEFGGNPGEAGIRVEFAMQGSPAEKGGLKEGDIIVELKKKSLIVEKDRSLLDSFKNQIEKMGAGDEIELVVLREMERVPLQVVLGSPLRVEPILKEHEDLEKKDSHPSLLEKTLEQTGTRAQVEKTLDRIRENSYELGTYQLISTDNKKNPFRLGEIDYLLHFPMRGPSLAEKLSGDMQEALKQRQMMKLYQKALGEMDIFLELPEKKDKKRLREFHEYLEEWKIALGESSKKMEQAFAKLSRDELEFLFASAPELLRQPPEPSEEEPTKEELHQANEELLKFLRLAFKIDYEKLLSAFMKLVMLVDFEYFDYLNGLEDRVRELTESYPLVAGRSGVEGKVLMDEDFGFGRVIVGGPGRNEYIGGAALIIDLGGDDVYRNSAGGSRKEGPLSICIDLNGNDTYRAQEDFSQGSGRMGMGILIDLDGDDIYDAGNYSQGTGYFGFGLLYDEKGDDRYLGKTANQGAGFFGVGLLLDGKGDDSYHSQLYSQGFGMTKGFGAIVDSQGEDLYFAGKEYQDFREPGKAYQSLSQGVGFGLRPFKSNIGASGGVGLLSDGGGNDTYHAGYFSQGASYWYALGMLVDESGHDTYHSRRYSQGAGIHRSIGILLDKDGDDQYSSAYGVSQGCGHDEAVGILRDKSGNDQYQGGVLVQGTGNAGGVGILLDNKGADMYYSKGNSQGWGQATRHEWGSFGLLMDLGGGQDRYSMDERNNGVLLDEEWGLRIDAN